MSNSMNHKTIIHLLSGGVDSVAMLYDLKGQGHSVHCLLIDYKQKHIRELNFARDHCRKLDVLYSVMDIPDIGGLRPPSWVVPNRNAIFLSLAVSLAAQSGGDTVTIGCNKDDAVHFPDCKPEFLAAMNAAVKQAGYEIELCAPYADKTKKDVVDLARSLQVDLKETWSCYHGSSRSCGRCLSCQQLKGAM